MKARETDLHKTRRLQKFVTFTSAPNKQSVIIRFNIRSDTHFNFQLGVKFSKNECRV